MKRSPPYPAPAAPSSAYGRDVVVASVFKKLEQIVRGRPAKLQEEIVKMREWLTRDRTARPSGYMNQPRAMSAYTAYHLPLHLPEIFWILEQNVRRLGLPLPHSILDLGCGPGTATLSFLLWSHLRQRSLSGLEEIQLFDQSSRALDTAADLVKTLLGALPPEEGAPKPAPRLQKVRGNLNYPVDRKRFGVEAQWIFLSHVLNEYGNGPRHRQKKFDFLCRLAREHLPQSGGLLFIVEPPLREPTLDLMWLRDRIAREGMKDLTAPTFGEDGQPNAAGDFGDDAHSEDGENDRAQGAAEPGDDELQFPDEEEAFGSEAGPKESFFSMPGASILAPCPEGTLRCPMALAKAGWCYAQPFRKDFRAAGLCPWDREIEDAMRITWTQPGFSYLVVQAYGEQKAREDIYGFRAGREGIGVTDQDRVPAMVCRDKRLRKENPVPHRGAYLAAKTPTAEAPLSRGPPPSLRPRSLMPRNADDARALPRANRPVRVRSVRSCRSTAANR